MKTVAAIVIAFVIAIVNAYTQETSGEYKGELQRGEDLSTFVVKIELEKSN